MTLERCFAQAGFEALTTSPVRAMRRPRSAGTLRKRIARRAKAGFSGTLSNVSYVVVARPDPSQV